VEGAGVGQEGGHAGVLRPVKGGSRPAAPLPVQHSHDLPHRLRQRRPDPAAGRYPRTGAVGPAPAVERRGWCALAAGGAGAYDSGLGGPWLNNGQEKRWTHRAASVCSLTSGEDGSASTTMSVRPHRERAGDRPLKPRGPCVRHVDLDLGATPVGRG
jgi:hypothetical protein